MLAKLPKAKETSDCGLIATIPLLQKWLHACLWIAPNLLEKSRPEEPHGFKKRALHDY